MIGDEIKITVVRVGPDKVRIGIDAPPHLRILREELATEPGEQRAAAEGFPAAGGSASHGRDAA